MKLNPRTLALAGLIAAAASDCIYKIGMSILDPSSPEGKITIPFVPTESTVKHMKDGKIISIDVTKEANIFIPRVVSAYILLFVVGSIYNIQ